MWEFGLGNLLPVMGGRFFNKVSMKFTNNEIQIKLKSPGFFEGVITISDIFSYSTKDELLGNWEYVKQYLKCYEVPLLSLTKDGVRSDSIRPFQSGYDLELAKYIMTSLLIWNSTSKNSVRQIEFYASYFLRGFFIPYFLLCSFREGLIKNIFK